MRDPGAGSPAAWCDPEPPWVGQRGHPGVRPAGRVGPGLGPLVALDHLLL